MCGFSGLWSTSGSASIRYAIGSMTEVLRHRGPDDGDVWLDDATKLALGHRRLSILDLSPAGHQPMHSPCGRYTLVYNGEIYNHLEIRGKLQGARGKGLLEQGERLEEQGVRGSWRGHSDTETLLAAIEAWGVEEALQECVGMFSFALWDREERLLTLARDRFGEKPLYYGWVNGDFVFGSELKAIRAYPGFNNPVCRQALGQFLRFMYVPAPGSIYEDIFKLEPGSYLQVQGTRGKGQGASSEIEVVRRERYWRLSDVVCGERKRLFVNEGKALGELENVLSGAVAGQRLADVPLGAFLSGGVDSSLIVSLMQQQSARPVKTFTVGFEEAGFDESPHARAVARHLGTDHHEMFVTAGETQDIIPQLPSMYDEPFADSSQIPTHLVCRAARQQVTVALSGDGGDELFGGYNRYFWGPRVWDKLSWLPFGARRMLGAAVTMTPVVGWDGIGAAIKPLSRGGGVARLGDKAHKLAGRLSHVRDMDDLYLSLVSEWQSPEALVKGLESGGVSPSEQAAPAGFGVNPWDWADSSALMLDDARDRMMFRDSASYLPDDILCKVDRAAMATSLETRVPFLDYRVAEVAWRLPMSMKIRGNEGKWALRQILHKYVPRELIERPKAGFGIPVGQWLRGPLRGWAEALLDTDRLEREGYLHPEPIQRVWQQHLSGRYDGTARLWAVLMFQSWLEENKGKGQGERGK